MPSPSRREPAAFSRPQWLLLLAATLVGAWLRLWHLGEWSLWVDEAHTWRDATIPLHGEFGFLNSDRALYPTTFGLVRALLALGLCDGSEGALRLPFALVGIATVPLLAVLGRVLVGPAAALLAAAWLAIDPWHVFWSQNARGYVFVVLFAALAANRIAHWLDRGRRGDLLAALAAIAIGSLCHPTCALVGAGFALLLVLRRLPPLTGRRWLLVAAAAAALVLLLPTLVRLTAPFQGFLQAKGDPSLLHFGQTSAFYFGPLRLLAAAAGAALLLATAPWRARLLACLAGAPFLVLAVLGGALVKVTARYAIAALPIVLWLAAVACTGWLASRRAARQPGAPGALRLAALALPVLLGVDLLLGVAAYHGEQHGQRARWRDGCARAAALAQGRPLHLLTNNFPTVLYYLRREHWQAAPADPYPGMVVQPLLGWRLLGRDDRGHVFHDPGGRAHLRWLRDQAAAQGAVFAVLVTLPELREIDRDGSLWQALQQDFELVEHLPCWVGPKDESLYLFAPNAP